MIDFAQTEKWKRAVVHLECAADSKSIDERDEHIRHKNEELRERKITIEEFEAAAFEGNRDKRFHGTAIFLKRNARKYLVTARHVLWDETTAKREIKTRQLEYEKRGRSYDVRSHEAELSDQIHNIIFRVPTLLEPQPVTQPPSHRAFLMNLGAGPTGSHSYTFSSPELDLAVISLDGGLFERKFLAELESSGYSAVDFSEVSEGPTREGSDLETVGFPESTAVLGQIVQSRGLHHWSSSHVSLPVWSFGRVAMLHPDLEFFWADMSIYPGNSGGPVIEDGKLCGVVSAQAMIPLDGAHHIGTRIPFGRIIKARFLAELLDAQDQNSEWRKEMLKDTPLV